MPNYFNSSHSFLSDEERENELPNNKESTPAATFNVYEIDSTAITKKTNLNVLLTLYLQTCSFLANKNSIYLVLLTILEATIVIALESVLLSRFNQRLYIYIYIYATVDRHNSLIDLYSLSEQSSDVGLQKGIPVYLSIFIFSLVFQVGLAWDAVRHVI